MKMITLNTWGGKIREPFISFITSHQDDIDVFCFQEVYHNAENIEGGGGFVEPGSQPDLFTVLLSLLPNHDGYFCPTVGDYYGIATFVRKSILVVETRDILIYENHHDDGEVGKHSRKALWHAIRFGEKQLSILNVHGLWNGNGKTDTPDRIEQSRRIKDFMNSIGGSQIICGDFNLLPDTESLSIVADGMQNLVTLHNVTTTRTSYYTRVATSGTFADYIFASPDLHIVDFRVLPDEVSDHAALFVSFDI